MKRRIVVALGGNALLKKGQKGTISEQFDNAIESMQSILPLIKEGHDIVITHGNGPTIGHMMIRVESGLSRNAPYVPLGLCVADSQGGLGYTIELCLDNLLFLEDIKKESITLITSVLVDKNDPAFIDPTKPIGPFYTEKEMDEMKREHKDWIIKEDAGRGWRRVVPSPKPITVINKDTIKKFVDQGYIVIAAGGGGVPVIHRDNKTLKGVPAVIDKDWSSQVLANEIGADTLMILTATDKVCLNFGKENEQCLDKMTVAKAKEYMREGHFPEGSMGPKVEGAINFIENGGKEAIICSLENAFKAFNDEAGTRIVP